MGRRSKQVSARSLWRVLNRRPSFCLRRPDLLERLDVSIPVKNGPVKDDAQLGRVDGVGCRQLEGSRAFRRRQYGLQLPRQRVGHCGVVRPVRNLRQLPAILKVERKIRFGQKIPRRHPERPLIVRQIEGNHRDGLVRRRAAARFWGGILQNRRREI